MPSIDEISILNKINRTYEEGNQSGLDLSYNGNEVIERIFFLYLMRKYNSFSCIYLLNKLPITIYAGFKDDDTRNNYDNIHTLIHSCISNTDVEVVVFPITIIMPGELETIAHANLLIYRKKYNSIEQFEPNGSSAILDVGEKIEYVFKKIANKFPLLTFVQSGQVCPYTYGLQAIEGLSDLYHEPEKYGGGYCVLWSVFFTELIFKKPNITSREILDIFFKKISKMTMIQRGNYLRKIMHGYVVLLKRQLNQFFTFIIDNFEDISVKNVYTTKTLRIIHTLINLEIEGVYLDENEIITKLKQLKKDTRNKISYYENMNFFQRWMANVNIDVIVSNLKIDLFVYERYYQYYKSISVIQPSLSKSRTRPRPRQHIEQNRKQSKKRANK
jgi:hypothetical protein